MTTGLFDATTEPNTKLVATGPIAPLPATELSPLVLIDKALERGHDPGKLYELAQKWQADIAAERFAQALATFQAKCPQIKKERSIEIKGGSIPFASLDDIMRGIQGLLAECGLAVTFSAGLTDKGQLTAKCMIHHGRHVEASEITVPVPSGLNVSDTQKMGAALSYAKRYALCAALNIVVTSEDNDAARLFQCVNEHQLGTLEDWVELLKPTPFKLAGFLKWLGVEKLSDIAANDFDKAANELAAQARNHGVAK